LPQIKIVSQHKLEARKGDDFLRKIARFVAAAVDCCMAAVLILTIYIQGQLPNQYSVVAGEEITFTSAYPIEMVHASDTTDAQVYSNVGNSYKMDLKLLGVIPVKTVEINVVDRKIVTVSGAPFGIKMFTDGLMVVGMSDVPTSDGRSNPAKEAGLQVGDILETFNGVKLNTNEQLAELMAENGGNAIQVEVKRDQSTFSAEIKPVRSTGDNQYRLGVWVRDSSAGIGTMTYYDQNSGLFTGLGHAVCDVDTGDIMPLSNGEVVPAQITGCKKGEAGDPGELKGKFTEEAPLGTLAANTSTGVYGLLYSRNLYLGEQVPLAMKHEVKTGKAYIYTTLEGNTPGKYEIEIEKVVMNEGETGQNMVIHVTDPVLLEKTGGIVQGMSGSPIIQNGMLVGSVTHVFVKDPTRGFGIFAENIQDSAKNVLFSIKQAS
jgi:stage IV sporulation protein B